MKHTSSCEISFGHCKFINTLIDKEHLAKCIKATRLSPWLLYSLDMFQLCNRQAQAIWSTKQANCLSLMDKSMLTRERTHSELQYPRRSCDGEGSFFQFIDALCVVNIAVGNINSKKACSAIIISSVGIPVKQFIVFYCM